MVVSLQKFWKWIAGNRLRLVETDVKKINISRMKAQIINL